MEKTNHINSCDSRVYAYKNGKTMEKCKEEARENTRAVSKELLEYYLLGFICAYRCKSSNE